MTCMYKLQAQPEHTLDLAKILNDDLAQSVAKYPTRFAAFGTLPMQAPELAAQELKRCVKELGRPSLFYSMLLRYSDLLHATI